STAAIPPLSLTTLFRSVCPGTNIVSYLWDFGDGQTSTEQNPEHIYTSVGEFAVRLTIEDEDGYSSSRSKKVMIIDNPLPVVDLRSEEHTSELQSRENLV